MWTQKPKADIHIIYRTSAQCLPAIACCVPGILFIRNATAGLPGSRVQLNAEVWIQITIVGLLMRIGKCIPMKSFLSASLVFRQVWSSDVTSEHNCKVHFSLPQIANFQTEIIILFLILEITTVPGDWVFKIMERTKFSVLKVSESLEIGLLLWKVQQAQ